MKEIEKIKMNFSNKRENVSDETNRLKQAALEKFQIDSQKLNDEFHMQTFDDRYYERKRLLSQNYIDRINKLDNDEKLRLEELDRQEKNILNHLLNSAEELPNVIKTKEVQQISFINETLHHEYSLKRNELEDRRNEDFKLLDVQTKKKIENCSVIKESKLNELKQEFQLQRENLYKSYESVYNFENDISYLTELKKINENYYNEINQIHNEYKQITDSIHKENEETRQRIGQVFEICFETLSDIYIRKDQFCENQNDDYIHKIQEDEKNWMIYAEKLFTINSNINNKYYDISAEELKEVFFNISEKEEQQHREEKEPLKKMALYTLDGIIVHVFTDKKDGNPDQLVYSDFYEYIYEDENITNDSIT